MTDYVVKWATREEFEVGTYMGREVFRSECYPLVCAYIQSVVFENPDKWYYIIKQTWFEDELPHVEWDIMNWWHEW